MYNLKSKHIIIWDTEYTSWKGSCERKWSGQNEFREIVEIGAIKIDTVNFKELESFHVYVKPKINSTLSDYFINLTGIRQETINSKGIDFIQMLKEFEKWSEGLDGYSFGNDELVIAENCGLNKISFPFRNNMFRNARDIFTSFGIDSYSYNSGSINQAIGIESEQKEHTALGDAKNVVNSLRKLYIG